MKKLLKGLGGLFYNITHLKQSFKAKLKDISDSRGKIFSNDADFEKMYNKSIELKKEKALLDELNSIDLDNVDILDYVSVYLSDLNISSGALKNINSIIESITKDNPKKMKELRKKLKEIRNITGYDKYNSLMDIFEKFDDIEDELTDDIEDELIDDIDNVDNVDNVDNTTNDVSNKVSEILESLKQSKSESDEVLESYNKEIEDAKAKLNKQNDIFDGMDDEIKSARSGIIKINPSVIETINTNNNGDKQIIDSNVTNILTKQDYWNDYKSNKISVKELVDACNKIDEKNQEQYDKKCENEYKLYQERMSEILELTNKISALKSKICNMGDIRFINDEKKLKKYGKCLSKLRKLEIKLDALSTRIVVLEKRGYAREYELKLEQERQDYVEYWEKSLSEKEKKEENIKQANIEILETFTDEEIESMRKNDFNASEIETVMKFKNIMKK